MTEAGRPAMPEREPEWTAMLRRAAAGDEGGLADLYDATSHMVFGLALRMLADRTVAEDVVVEVYAQAWKAAANYDPARGTPSAWLFTLTRSRSIDFLRSRNRNQATESLEAAEHVHSADPDPEDAAAANEHQRLVHDALDRLAREQREAIELAYFGGLSHTEIAMKLGQPLGTVKTRIRAGMMRLRDLLGPALQPAFAAGRERLG